MITCSLSLVTPVYSGEKFLKSLIMEVEKVKVYFDEENIGIKIAEIIFVCDGVIDNSIEILYDEGKGRPWLKILELSKNYGQHPATCAGILHTSGDWVVTLDEDLQHHPKHIKSLLKKVLNNSDDICYARPSRGVHSSFIKDIAAVWFKRIIGTITSNRHVKDFNSFRIIRGNIARAAASTSKYDSYFDIILHWFTDRITTLHLDLLDERNISGESQSGYSVMSLVKHGKRMIMTSKIKILRSGIILGILSFALSIILMFYALINRVYNPELELITEWSSLMIALLFIGGLLSLIVGFILESVSDILIHLKGKPTFFVVSRQNDKEILKKLSAL